MFMQKGYVENGSVFFFNKTKYVASKIACEARGFVGARDAELAEGETTKGM